ncbi:ATP-binding protein [Pyrococcus kukulkanii]|uniref:ATP-binding protein n=1 Tax=Pyrococcus kukulkanii TaxID=1609559 RepID=UPI0035684D97
MFFDREKELSYLRSLLNSEPNQILFIYGPINSGKTTLLLKFLESLGDEGVGIYVNLRSRPVLKFDFRDLFFSRTRSTDSMEITFGIPVPKKIWETIESPRDAFGYITDFLGKLRKKGRLPIIVFDELQVLKDLKVNGPLIYELFNFFIHLTKELHLAHVIVSTSDGLFLSNVYTNASLYGRAKYFLVDDFDEETALAFLISNGLTEEESKIVVDYFGGKPVYLVEVINEKRAGRDVEEYCREQFMVRLNQVKPLVRKLNDPSILIDLGEREVLEYDELTEDMLMLARENVIFIDPVRGVIRPQGRLELKVIRFISEKL